MKNKFVSDLKKWCDILVVDQPTEEVPKGWFTISEICEETKRSRACVNRQLKVSLEDGLCECKTFRIRSGLVVRPIPHYRIK